jgi:hypothetical protein
MAGQRPTKASEDSATSGPSEITAGVFDLADRAFEISRQSVGCSARR